MADLRLTKMWDHCCWDQGIFDSSARMGIPKGCTSGKYIAEQINLM